MVIVAKMGKMEMNKAHRRAWGWGLRVSVVAVLIAVLACAGVSVAGEALPQPEQPAKSDAGVLRERAQAYWQARLKDDMATAFTYEDPLRRKQLSLNEYVRNIGTGVKFTEVKVSDVKIIDDQADVRVDVQGRYLIAGWEKIPVKRTLIDDWQKIDGQWVHVLDFHVIRAGKPRVTPDGTVTYHDPAMGVLPRKDSQ